MKVIIAGTRKKDYVIPSDGRKLLANLSPLITEVVSGNAKGADAQGELFAKKFCIPVKPFPAKWKRPDGSTDYSAGPRRNSEMVKYADALIAFPGGDGTADVTKKAKAAGLLVIEITPARTEGKG